MAELQRQGRVLPEWPIADLDRLVCSAPAALVSCRKRLCDAGPRTGSGVDVPPAATLAYRMLPDCYPLAGWGHPDCQLHVPELSGAGAGCAVAGRQTVQPLGAP